MRNLFFLLFTLFSFSLLGQSADEIVNNHVKAIGGIENWTKLNTIYMEMSTDMQGQKLPIKMWQVHEKAMRIEFVVQGMTGIQVVTDKDGWSLMPFMGQKDPEPTNEEQLKQAQSQLDIHGQLINYEAKGSSIEYLGEDEIEGVEVYKLRLTDKNKIETTFFIDKESYYIVKSVTKTSFQGQEIEAPSIYSNYKKIGDIYMPHTMNSGMGIMEIEKIEINPKVDETIFKMPAK
jgi:outer membrane lipoprotein-sorting protein